MWRLAGIVVVWAANWLLIKRILGDIGPLDFTALRLLGAALVIGALSPVFRSALLPPVRERAALALIGVLQIGGVLGLAAIGLQYVAAGRAAVLTYTLQLWALPLGWLIAGDRPGPLATAGGMLAFVGLVVFFNPALVDWTDERALFGNGLLIAAAVLWALGASLYRRRLWRSSFWTQTFWQLLAGGVAVGVAALLLEAGRPVQWTPAVLGVLVFNWFVGTALSYWWWGQVLAVMPAARAGQIVSLVPIVALLGSAAVAGERLTADVAASVALIGCGIVLTLRARNPPARREAAPARADGGSDPPKERG
jgi:drug/metabolite transporter (DMT)-like permease